MAKRSPIHGYNHNVGYRGILFHVQTEDSGIVNPHIFTHLFHGGVIINTRKVIYDAESDDGVVKSLMQAQHKAIMRELKRGLFDDKIDVYLAAIPGLLPRGSAAEEDPGTGAGINTHAGKQDPAAAAPEPEPDAGTTETNLPIVMEEMLSLDTLPTVTATTPLAANATPRADLPPPIPAPSSKPPTIPPPSSPRTGVTKPPPIPSPSSGDLAAAKNRAAAATPPSGVASISTTTLAGRAASPSTSTPMYATLRGAVPAPPTPKADASRPAMPSVPATTIRDIQAAAPNETGAVEQSRPTTTYDTSAALEVERATRTRAETDVNEVAQVYSPPLPSAAEPPGVDPQRPGEYSQFKRRETASRDSLDTRALEDLSDAIPRSPALPTSSGSVPTRTASQPVIERPPGVAVEPPKTPPRTTTNPNAGADAHQARSRSVTAARIAPAGSRPGSSGGVVVSRPAVIIGAPRTATPQPTQPRTATPQPTQPATARTATPPAGGPRSRNTRDSLIRGGAGHDLTAEKSLDDVILAYLAEDQKDR